MFKNNNLVKNYNINIYTVYNLISTASVQATIVTQKFADVPIEKLGAALHKVGISTEALNLNNNVGNDIRSEGVGWNESVSTDDGAGFMVPAMTRELAGDNDGFDPFAVMTKEELMMLNMMGPYRAMLQEAFSGVHIDNYGCWCLFGDSREMARGKPQNDLDMLCKYLQRGYDCVVIDEELDKGQPGTCLPWDVDYEYDLDGIADIPEMCGRLNPGDTCKARSCMVEMHFMKGYLKEIFSTAFVVDTTYSHEKGPFDFNGECLPVGGIDSPKMCCGEYPGRFSYKTLNGKRECCNDKVYNADLFSCCNGVISMSVC